MSLQDRYIEQCTAEEVLASVLDVFLKPAAKVTENMGHELESGKQKIVNVLAAAGISASTDDTLDTLASKVVQAIGISNTQGVVPSSALPLSIGQILCGAWSSIQEIKGDEITSLNAAAINAMGSLKRLIVNNVSNIPIISNSSMVYLASEKATSVTYNGAPGVSINSPLKCLYLPSYDVASSMSLLGSTEIRHRTLHGFGSGGFGWNNYHNNLYDCVFTGGLTSTCSFSGSWRAGNALSDTLSTLCDHDEWDDANEPSGGFANNRAKFLWYFEHHFLPCVKEVSTSQTMTFYSTMYSVISAAYSEQDQTKTLKELIEDKGWTVASA